MFLHKIRAHWILWHAQIDVTKALSCERLAELKKGGVRHT